MSDISFIQIMDSGVKTMIFNKFKSYLNLSDQNKDLVFFPMQIAQRKVAEKRGESSVEFMSVWRDGIEFDWQRQRSSVARNGIRMQYDNSSSRTQIVTVKAIPAKINYRFWLWSRDLDLIMKAAEAYLFWIHTYPNMVLYYNGLYEMDMYMKFGPISDRTNYDIYEKGQYFVYEFPIELEGWILTSIYTKTILKIILDLFVREGTKPNYRDTLIAEYIIEATP
jgi:hypothetical protein